MTDIFAHCRLPRVGGGKLLNCVRLDIGGIGCSPAPNAVAALHFSWLQPHLPRATTAAARVSADMLPCHQPRGNGLHRPCTLCRLLVVTMIMTDSVCMVGSLWDVSAAVRNRPGHFAVFGGTIGGMLLLYRDNALLMSARMYSTVQTIPRGLPVTRHCALHLAIAERNESYQKLLRSTLPDEAPLSSALESKNSSIPGAILFLAPIRTMVSFGMPRVCLLKHAIQSVDKHFNSIFGPYPIIVFIPSDPNNVHDGASDGASDAPYTEADRVSIRSWAPHSNVTFVEIPMYSGNALPSGFNISQFYRWKAGLDGGVPGRPLGYRSMCRLWSGRLQQMSFMQSFQYYMRLDDDSLLTGPLPFDPFEMMKERHLQYAYHSSMADYWGIDKLWELASPFMTPESLQNMKEMDLLPPHGKYTGRQPYNNFHVASVKMWLAPKWLCFRDVMDQHFGFMKYRFGDANVHAVAMGMLLNASEVAVWHDLPYGHNTNDIPDYPPSIWTEECGQDAVIPERVRASNGSTFVTAAAPSNVHVQHQWWRRWWWWRR
jgi:hypothetical protein